jgi:hypothetical protein
MKFGSLTTTSLYRVMSIAAPILCVGIAIGMSSYEMMHVRAVEQKTADVRAANTEARSLIDSIQKSGACGYLATVPDTRDEQVQFVDTIRKTADACHVKLTQWASTTVNTLGVPEAADPALKEALTRVQPAANQIGLTGSYSDIRAFIQQMLSQDRLVTISSVKWIRAAKPPETAVSMIVTRYVMMTAPVSKPAASGNAGPLGAKS